MLDYSIKKQTHKKEFATVPDLLVMSNFSSLITNQYLKPLSNKSETDGCFLWWDSTLNLTYDKIDLMLAFPSKVARPMPITLMNVKSKRLT